MNIVNTEIKKITEKARTAQTKLHALLKNRQEWLDEARKYAEAQKKEVQKLIHSDISKVKSFLETEKKQFDKFQKQIPSEVDKLRDFVNIQRKEFEKLLTDLKRTSLKVAGNNSKKSKKAASRKPAKKAAAKKTTSKKVQQKAAPRKGNGLNAFVGPVG